MNKLGITLLIFIFSLILSTVSYADTNNDTQNNKATNNDDKNHDFHFGVELGMLSNSGTTYSKTEKNSVFKYCNEIGRCWGIKFSKNPLSEPIEDNRQSSSMYFNMQFGVNFYRNYQDNVITPYIDYTSMQEFVDASASSMTGIGVLGSFRKSENSYYIAGIEFHDTSFDYRKLKSSDYMHIPKKDSKLSYSGSGITLVGGVLHKNVLFKLIYLSNKYSREKIDTGSEFSDKVYEAYTPKSISAKSFGLGIGLKF